MSKLEKTYRKMLLEGKALKKEAEGEDDLEMNKKDQEVVTEEEEAEAQSKQKMGATPNKPPAAANRPADNKTQGLSSTKVEAEMPLPEPKVPGKAAAANRPADNAGKGLKEAEDMEKDMDKEDEKDKEVVEAEDLTKDPVVKNREDDAVMEEDDAEMDDKDKEEKDVVAEAEAEDAKDDEEMKDKLAENTKTAVKQMGNLLEDHGLLEETHKDQVKTLFEAALSDRTKIIRENLQEQYARKLDRAIKTSEDSLIESLDRYLGKVVNEWLEENRLAVESGVKSEITESFLGAMKSVFEDHYVVVPDEKLNVVESVAAENEELEAKLNEEMKARMDAEAKLSAYRKADVIATLSEDLTLTERERLVELTEEIDFSDRATFTKKAKTIKENFLRKPVKGAGDVEILNEDAYAGNTGNKPVSAVEQKYGRVLSRMSENKFDVKTNASDK